VDSAADGRVDRMRVRSGLASAGIELTDAQLDGLLAETVEHAVRVQAEAAARARLDHQPTEPRPRLTLPEVVDGVELGALYELAENLTEQGVGVNPVPHAASAGRR
jgi:ribosomal protein S12 methylthiotransferase accessory factor YcaO